MRFNDMCYHLTIEFLKREWIFMRRVVGNWSFSNTNHKCDLESYLWFVLKIKDFGRLI